MRAPARESKRASRGAVRWRSCKAKETIPPGGARVTVYYDLVLEWCAAVACVKVGGVTDAV